jgi:hypothetical protein
MELLEVRQMPETVDQQTRRSGRGFVEEWLKKEDEVLIGRKLLAR